MRNVIGLVALCALLAVCHVATRGPVGLEEVFYQVPNAQLLAGTQQKATSHLMEEGQIQINPESDNPSADFYAQGADAGDDEDIPDAGPGGVLPGWTKPELLKVPEPADLESFVAPSGNGPVFAKVDYKRNPGAVSAVNSARSSISSIKSSMTEARDAAEAAKDKFEVEEQKASVEEGKYRQYEQKIQRMRAMMRAGRGGGSHPTPQRASGGRGSQMWGAPPPRQQAASSGQQAGSGTVSESGGVVSVDTSAGADFSAEVRRAMYRATAAKLRADERRVVKDENVMRSAPLQLPQLRSVPSSPVRRAESESDEKRARIVRARSALERDEARELVAREHYSQVRRKAAPFRAAKWTEGCPEGTPGCKTSGSMGYRGRPSSGVLSLEQKNLQEGDRTVSVREAMAEVPKFF